MERSTTPREKLCIYCVALILLQRSTKEDMKRDNCCSSITLFHRLCFGVFQNILRHSKHVSGFHSLLL